MEPNELQLKTHIIGLKRNQNLELGGTTATESERKISQKARKGNRNFCV